MTDPEDLRDRAERWVTECLTFGYQSLDNAVDVDPDIHGGVPVLHGTRFTVSQALAEIAETRGPADFAEDFGLDVESVRRLLVALSLVFQRPWADAVDAGAAAMESDFRIGALKLTKPIDGKIQITNHGEGGEFSEAELAEVIQTFVGERL